MAGKKNKEVTAGVAQTRLAEGVEAIEKVLGGEEGRQLLDLLLVVAVVDDLNCIEARGDKEKAANIEGCGDAEAAISLAADECAQVAENVHQALQYGQVYNASLQIQKRIRNSALLTI
ncbi:hypothetical protein RvY_15113 [Ramazzottius varieornatus]|uniref:Uncharacterized protein n=1 Tax=Ramazzottius varieornatus TaxID=947166 RepID=A0A1D1VV58_RAMVA|nr:hypothetical protein RvY_15113 [Ramazzottius varieornatus]